MKKQVINSKKAVMVGCGFVGSASALALMQSGLFTEIVLIDADKNKGRRRSHGYQPWNSIYQSDENICWGL